MENRFGAITVMRIEIPDRDTSHSLQLRMKRGDRDVIEITKAHRLSRCRMVPGWSHQRKHLGASARELRCRQRRSHSPSSVIEDIVKKGRIRIEVLRYLKPLQMRFTMSQAQDLFESGWRDFPNPLGMNFTQIGRGAESPRRLIRTRGRAVISTLRIVENLHQ